MYAYGVNYTANNMIFVMLLIVLLIVAGTEGNTLDSDACGNLLGQNSYATLKNDFILQQLLLSGFRAHGLNTYSIRRGGFISEGGSKQQCVTVNYNIECEENTTAVCNNTNCKDKVDFDKKPFFVMWTTFNGSTTTGNILLKQSAFDLRIFGFEFCDVYIDPININITLESPEQIPPSCYDLKASLVEFTTLVSKN